VNAGIIPWNKSWLHPSILLPTHHLWSIISGYSTEPVIHSLTPWSRALLELLIAHSNSQEITPLLFHYHVHNSLLPVPTMSKMNPICTLQHSLISIHFNMTLQTMLPNQNFVCITHLPPCALHAPPISSSFIWSLKQHLVKSTNYGSPHNAIFSSLPLLHVLSRIILPSPCSETPTICVLPWETKFHTHIKQVKL
jgi:hypothetical protein